MASLPNRENDQLNSEQMTTQEAPPLLQATENRSVDIDPTLQGMSFDSEISRKYRKGSSEQIAELLRTLEGNGEHPPPDAKDEKPQINPTESGSELEKLSSGTAKISRSAQVIGRTGCFATFILLLTIMVVAFYIMRDRGWLPFPSTSSITSPSKSGALASEFSRSYVLIAAQPGQPSKLYFFDQQNESISEVVFDPTTGPGKPNLRGKTDLIPSADGIVPSPDGKKVALIANRESYRSGIYVLDFSRLEEPESFTTQWTKGLPPGYSVRSHSIASWSPDNNALAFVASKENQPDLFISLSENKVQRVTYQGRNIGTVFWLNDQYLAFVSDWEGKDQMYVINRNGGDLKKIPR